MKRETMRLLRQASWGEHIPPVLRSREADDILAELKRLRRKAKKATATDLAVWWDGFRYGAEFAVVDKQAAERSAKSRIAALKKGGRK